MLKSIEGEEDHEDVGEGKFDSLGKKAETPVHIAEF
jgi:hypothetical protein